MTEAKRKCSRERAFVACNVLNFSFSHRHLIKYNDSVIIIKLVKAGLLLTLL
jgi:hypothetical protein